MGRKIPDDNLSLTHPVMYLSFLAAGFAASIVILAVLCSIRFRKKKLPPPESLDPIQLSKESDPSTMEATATSPVDPTILEAVKVEDTVETVKNDPLTKELPLPPAMQQPKESNINNIMKRSTSERKLSKNLSIKMPRSFSVARNLDNHFHLHHHRPRTEEKKKGRMKPEDSVWMKTIILGDKCNPDEEEDAVIYEAKGKKISAYHPKHSASISVSRQASFIDPDAIHVLSTQIQQERDQ